MPKRTDSNGEKVELVPTVIRFTKLQKQQLLKLSKKKGKPVNELVRIMVSQGLEIREDDLKSSN